MNLPKFELYEEGSQVRRSSKSIAMSIVEGYGRRLYKTDFIKYLIYAQSECDETMLHLDFLKETGSLSADTLRFSTLEQDYDTLSKRINRFIQWVEKNWQTRTANQKL
jgi:four helix bundle protein